MYLGNTSKNFTVGKLKKPGLNGYVYDFSVVCNTIEVSNIVDIHKYLMKKKLYKTMIRLFNQIFIAILSFRKSLATTCIPLTNQACMNQNTFINLNPDEHNQGLCYYDLWLF